jgi:hypothetical protein
VFSRKNYYYYYYYSTTAAAAATSITTTSESRGSVVVETVLQTGRLRFETRLGEHIFSVYLILPAALGPGVYSASNRNEYQKQKNNVSGEYRAAGA